MNTSDWQMGDKVKALVIGPYKGGKTFGALTFPRPNVMDFDKGIAVVRNPDFVAKHGLKSIEYEQFSEKSVDQRGVAKSHNALDDACRYFDKWMQPANRDKFDTWVIDSATTLTEAAATKAMILLGKPGLGVTSKTHEAALNSGLVIPKVQDYGAERSMVEQFIEMVRDADKHVVVLCHEQEKLDDAGNLTSMIPMLTGKSAQIVPLKFDEVWFLRIKREGTGFKRYLQTNADGVRKCGSRLGIPDGTPWEWGAISAELDKIRAKQAVVGTTQPSA